MLFKFTFTKDLKPTMEKVFANERMNLLKIRSKGLRSRATSWAMNKAFGIKTDISAKFEYRFISETEAEVTITTGLDFFVKDEKIFLKHLKKYERASDGKITMEMLEGYKVIRRYHDRSRTSKDKR
jgi:hypothetical protein